MTPTTYDGTEADLLPLFRAISPAAWRGHHWAGDMTPRLAAADLLDELGRSREAALMRDTRRHVYFDDGQVSDAHELAATLHRQAAGGLTPGRWVHNQGDRFLQNYLDYLLNFSSGDDGRPLDATRGWDDIHPSTLAAIVADTRHFRALHGDDEMYSHGQRDGRNFYLSRGGHGSGFFDDDSFGEEDRNRLQWAAKEFGEYDLFVGDDGMLHGTYAPAHGDDTPLADDTPDPDDIDPNQTNLSMYSSPAAYAYAGEYRIEPSQGDGYKITTPHGYIDYRPTGEGVNEIWWVESHAPGHGSELVDLMQQHHPADAVAWGVTSHAGEGLMRRWHAAHPDVGMVTGAHEGQFDPFGHGDEDEGYWDDGDWDDDEDATAYADPQSESGEPLSAPPTDLPADRPVTLVFGGSFSPFHSGHLNSGIADAVRHMQSKGHTVGNVVIAPSADRLLRAKLGDDLIPLADRTEIIRRSIAGVPGLEVSSEPGEEAEAFTGKLRRTQLADWAARKYPGTHVVNVTGEDATPVPAPSYPAVSAGLPGTSHAGYFYLTMPRDESDPNAISSTKIRRAIAAGQGLPPGWMRPDAEDYYRKYLAARAAAAAPPTNAIRFTRYAAQDERGVPYAAGDVRDLRPLMRSVSHAAWRGDPSGEMTPRLALADLMEELGRSREAALLRDTGRHLYVDFGGVVKDAHELARKVAHPDNPDGFIRPDNFTRRYIATALRDAQRNRVPVDWEANDLTDRVHPNTLAAMIADAHHFRALSPKGDHYGPADGHNLHHTRNSDSTPDLWDTTFHADKSVVPQLHADARRFGPYQLWVDSGPRPGYSQVTLRGEYEVDPSVPPIEEGLSADRPPTPDDIDHNTQSGSRYPDALARYAGGGIDEPPTEYGTAEEMAAAVEQNPHDATGHLALADWHDEFGSPEDAAFHRAMGAWFSPGSNPLSGIATPDRPFAVRGHLNPSQGGMIRLPEGVDASLLDYFATFGGEPAGSAGRFGGSLGTYNPEQHGTHPGLWQDGLELGHARREDALTMGQFSWPTYRDMEEAFRRAFKPPTRATRYWEDPEPVGDEYPEDDWGDDWQSSWGEYGDAAKVNAVIGGVFPDARVTETGWAVPVGGDRNLRIVHDPHQNGLVVDFFNTDPSMGSTASAPQVRPGTMDMVRSLQTLAQAALENGMKIGYGPPSDKRRGRLYAKLLAEMGYAPHDFGYSSPVTWWAPAHDLHPDDVRDRLDRLGGYIESSGGVERASRYEEYGGEPSGDFGAAGPDRDYWRRRTPYAAVPYGSVSGWLSPDGTLHDLGSYNEHRRWAMANGLGNDLDQMFGKGWVRVFSVGGDLVAHTTAPLGDRQRASLADHAVTNGLGRVVHDNEEDEFTLWSEHDQL